ncbi:MAG TPA: HAD-IA family hydrolase [Spongiibacteraceae bacterium]|jgi:putative hydrolase of the HAD superfamily|nr:HAD-IA family hydrolase [Spongiibacteraceae bacterium]HUH36908.1 HAD-IA family hydrolase [Spongiibacteraceae bacterium]
MSTVRAISFDLDDTLWDLAPVLTAAEQRTYAWLVARVPALSDRYDLSGLRDVRLQLLHTQPDLRHQITALRRAGVETALRELGLPAGEAAHLADGALEEFLRARHAVRYFDGALEVLAALQPRYVLGSLTNGNACPRRLGLDRYFSFSFSAEQLNASKPAPDLFRAAMAAAGVKAAELLHVGDHIEHDIEAAKLLGARAIWLNRAGQPWPGHRATPDATIGDLRELPAAIARLD